MCAAGPVAFAQTYSYPTYSSPIYSAPAYSSPSYSSGSGSSGSTCLSLSQNFGSGASDSSSGGAVSSLQQFLANQGYFAHAITGTFGPVTQAGVQKFQAAQNISATGYVGPLTRAASARVSCGTTGATQTVAAAPQILKLSPAVGPVNSTILMTGSGFLPDNGIYFDGYPLTREGSSNGTGLSFVVPSVIPAGKVGTGQHTVFVQNAGGSSNQITFTVVTPTIGVARPSIQSISPSGSLYAGQSSTWTVYLSVPSGYSNAMSLAPSWGDANLVPPSYENGETAYGSQVTLTHTYAFPGVYTATFTLFDSMGQVLSSNMLAVSVR